MTALTITHTPAEGTLLEDPRRDDRTAKILRDLGWRWSPRITSWYVPRSRGRAASRLLIARTVQLLTEAGFAVDVEIERHDAEHLEERAADTAAADAARVDPAAVAHQVATLETQQRKIRRSIDGYRNHLGTEFPPATGDRLTTLQSELATVDEDLSHWTAVRAQQVADGTTIALTREDVAVGDLIAYRGEWYPVLRVNAKSVSVQSSAGGSWTDTIPYQQISGHRRSRD